MRWAVQLAVLCLLAGTGGARPRVVDGRAPTELRHADRDQAIVAARSGERAARQARRDGVGPALAAEALSLAAPPRRILDTARASIRASACDSVRDVRSRGPPA